MFGSPRLTRFAALLTLMLVGAAACSGAESGDGDADGDPSATTSGGDDSSQTHDYGIYRDAIFQGAEMLPGSLEFAEWLVECLAAEGFGAVATGPGEVRGGSAPEQLAGFREAYEACFGRAVDDGVVFMGTPDENTLRLYYRAYVEVAYECLVEGGYPTTPPLSMEVWVQQRIADPGGVWRPHDLVWSIAESLEGACSQDIVDLLVELGRRDTEGGAP